ncbi:MAG: 50S ribosomal protein L25 [Proteobacteria bacterium]|nr:50S ribosomal protein L25 [Pseudomonadota bacterium]
MGEHSLAVEIRVGAGKGVARKLRAAGRLPAIVYGSGNDAIRVSLDPRRLDALLRSSEAGLNTLIDLEGDPSVSGKTVLVKELQTDPVEGWMLHADLYEVDPRATIEVEVPIRVLGQPVGVTLGGGILDHGLRELLIECLPRAIPDSIDVDVSALELGDSIHVRELPLPEGVVLKTDADLSVLSVVAPTVAEEETPAEGEDEGLEGEGVEGAEGEAAEGAEGEAATEGDEKKAADDGKGKSGKDRR